MRQEPITTPQIQPMPVREAMDNLEFVTLEQLRQANADMSRLAAEVALLRQENTLLRTERNFLQSYASDINASLDIMAQIWGRVREHAKQFALDTAKAEADAKPAPEPMRLDEASEAEISDLMSRIPPSGAQQMHVRPPAAAPQRRPDPRLPANDWRMA